MQGPDRPDPLAVLTSREGVASAMAAARDAVDALLRDRGLRRSRPGDTVEALLRGAAASATLAGSRCSADDLRAGRTDAVGAAALRVYAELTGLVPVWQRSPVQALARLHTLSTDPDDTARGRPTSPAGAERLQALGALVLRGTAAPAMVLAAIVHAEVASAHAFGDRDGLVARGAERLVLIHSGVDPAALTVPEAGHARSPDAYRAVLDGYREGGTPQVVSWLLHCAAAYAHGVERAPLG